MVNYDYETDTLLPDGSIWRECWQCGGEGYSHHDCGGDICFCFRPDDNILCDECLGEGGWMITKGE